MLFLWYRSDHCQLSIACAFLILASGFRQLENLPCEQLPCIRICRNKHAHWAQPLLLDYFYSSPCPWATGSWRQKQTWDWWNPKTAKQSWKYQTPFWRIIFFPMEMSWLFSLTQIPFNCLNFYSNRTQPLSDFFPPLQGETKHVC